MEESTSPELQLPGFRFHPTEEELLGFYLKNMVFGKKLHLDVIGFINIYLHDPVDLPGLAKIGEREWYFFVPRDRKHGSGGRPNRTTETGFWKATGSDRKILSLSDPKKIIGLKKTLVFYKGRAPRGCKTDWVMNEYRLPDSCPSPKDIVLCKIYRKATSLKVLEERAAMEEEMKTSHAFQPSPSPPLTPPMDTISYSSPHEEYLTAAQHMALAAIPRLRRRSHKTSSPTKPLRRSAIGIARRRLSHGSRLNRRRRRFWLSALSLSPCVGWGWGWGGIDRKMVGAGGGNRVVGRIWGGRVRVGGR